MKRLRVGDIFHPSKNTKNPYTVTHVSNTGYTVKQSGGRPEQYDTKIIHDLLRNDNWVLRRKPIVFTEEMEELFRI